jgi:hypothetical protein
MKNIKNIKTLNQITYKVIWKKEISVLDRDYNDENIEETTQSSDILLECKTLVIEWEEFQLSTWNVIFPKDINNI